MFLPPLVNAEPREQLHLLSSAETIEPPGLMTPRPLDLEDVER